MHTIEFGNERTRKSVTIVDATREMLTLSMHQQIEEVAVESYLTFGRALNDSYRRLTGRAALRNRAGDIILEVIFHPRKVDVKIDWGKNSSVIETDQSFLTTTVKQIGLWE